MLEVHHKQFLHFPVLFPYASHPLTSTHFFKGMRSSFAENHWIHRLCPIDILSELLHNHCYLQCTNNSTEKKNRCIGTPWRECRIYRGLLRGLKTRQKKWGVEKDTEESRNEKDKLCATQIVCHLPESKHRTLISNKQILVLFSSNWIEHRWELSTSASDHIINQKLAISHKILHKRDQAHQFIQTYMRF